MSIIMGGTFALFSDSENVGNHLVAGNLDITLVRTKLTSTYLTDRGFLDTITDDVDKDFTNNANENVFALDGALIVPKSKYIADMKITNNSVDAKSNVAFAYWIEIVYLGDDSVDLASQISITVDDGESKRLNQGLYVGSAAAPVGILGVNESGEFTVTVEFLNLDNEINNVAQGDSVLFDLVVHAVQYTGADPNP
jgi:predicted ribosomally synthesized peptide with SipW-like signal peptide